MASDPKETERSEMNAIEVFDYYRDSGDELNTEWVTQSFVIHLAHHGLLTIQCNSEEEDGDFYDGYLDQKNVSRSLTPSPNIQDEEFREDPEDCVDALALLTPAQIENRLHAIQSKKRSRSSTLTLQNVYGREAENSDSDESDSDDEEAQYRSSGSSDWEL